MNIIETLRQSTSTACMHAFVSVSSSVNVLCYFYHYYVYIHIYIYSHLLRTVCMIMGSCVPSHFFFACVHEHNTNTMGDVHSASMSVVNVCICVYMYIYIYIYIYVYIQSNVRCIYIYCSECLLLSLLLLLCCIVSSI